jgi:uncharacterized repeat protein (TIGR01451 family)
MKKFTLLLCMLLVLLIAEKNVAQALVCNDLVFISLDQNCSHTIIPEEMLEGILFSDCIVEVDKTAPYGNGPWVAPILGAADVGKTYQARVKHLPSGNLCWGNIKIEDKLPPRLNCTGLSTIDLNGGGPVTVNATDLSINAVDGCGTTTLAPTSFQYDCSDLGVQTVQLTATDQSGNTSTCLHTVLVADATNCLTCVSACPESVAVPYDQGNIDLLTAFQNNDLSAFDVFGNALFDTGCGLIDSTYIVDYQPGTNGQSWFTRQWWWVQGSGQLTICSQNIVFPRTHTVSVQGKIYLDTDDDCSVDAGEQGVQTFSLVLTKLPSGVTQTIYPASDGTYTADIIFGVQDLSAELHLVLPPNVSSVCPSALNIPNTLGTPVIPFDIGLQSAGYCPAMQVDMGNLFMRRCGNSYFYVNYCNAGLDTAFGAFVTVNLDSLISLQSASLPYTVSGADSVYTFQLGNVPPFFCGTISIQGTTSCAAMLGQTLCNEAYIYPDAPCGGAWQGPVVTLKAECSGDSVTLELKNSGLQDMTAPLNYIVVEDFIMYRDGAFQLDAGETFTIKTPANGATWRLESEQIPGFLVPGQVATAIEGCGGLNTPGLINAFGYSDNSINYDLDCGEVVGSFDPNDKNAVPAGYSDQHIIRANQTIDYKIRFQNTGTDTAFHIVVVDTLSPLLDVRTLELGASSHPYRLDIYPGGILHFVFKPIMLPDSNVNEVASHGYLKFKIAQQPDLADGTIIENTAAIYFDQNDPVLTNTVLHTIGYPFITIDPLAMSVQTSQVTCNGSADGEIVVTPAGGVAPYTFQWGNPNVQGDSLTSLAAGAYQLTLTDSHGNSLVQLFELTEPTPLNLTLDATPTIGNDNSGTASAQVSGGTAPYTYSWSNGATTANLSNLQAGTYTLIATDAHGCTQSSSAVVSQTFLPLQYTSNSTNPTCYNGTNGAITLVVTGGLLPYTFQWSVPAVTGSTPQGLSAGIYGVTVTDNNGSQFEEVFQLVDPSPITISMSSSPAAGSQNTGTAAALASGGAGSYSYLWNTGATTPQLSGLAAGTYTVVVTDANGCSESSTVVVEQVSLATDEPTLLSKILVWPNPAQDRIMLDLHQVLPQLLRLDLLTADGRLLRQFDQSNLQAQLTLNLGNDVASGMVLLVFYDLEGGIFTKKIVIR